MDAIGTLRTVRVRRCAGVVPGREEGVVADAIVRTVGRLDRRISRTGLLAGVAARVHSWAPRVEEQLGSEEGICVAIFENGWSNTDLLPTDYELTARLSMSWPAAKRTRFWAFPDYARMIERNVTSGIQMQGKLVDPRIDRVARGLVRQGPIRRLLWVFVRPDGSLEIEAEDAPRPRE